MNILINLIKKEIYARHMGSVFGVLWSLCNPMITVLTYVIVFKYIFPSRDEKFVLHLITGILHWTLFTSIVLQSCEWMTSNSSILKKVNFPRMLVPLSGFFLAMYYWVFFFVLYLCLFPLLGGMFNIYILIYPIILLFYLMFLFGLGLMLSVFYVTMRDLKYIAEVLTPVFFWLVPIIWVSGTFGGKAQQILNFNPLGVFFRAFEAILYFNKIPTSVDLLAAAIIGCLTLFIGIRVFRKRSRLVTEYF